MVEFSEEEDIQEEILEEETTEEVIEDEVPDEEEEVITEDDEEPDEEEEGESEEEEDIISLGDEVVNEPDPEEKKAPKWVKDLRKQNKELQRQLKEVKAKAEVPAEQPVAPTKKPTLEDADYDSEKYEAQLAEYIRNEAKVAQEQEETQKAFQRSLDAYNEKKTSLKVRDYDEAEQAITESFSVVQQNVILQTAENSALLVYALGKSKTKTEALAKIQDPAKLAYELGKLESQLKVSKRKVASAPERKVSTGGKGVSMDGQLKKLEADAMRTGDMSKLLAYERKLKRKKTT